VRADFHMTPKGRETVHNDIVFFVEVEESGKVGRVVEYIDPTASAKLQGLFKLNREEGDGK